MESTLIPAQNINTQTCDMINPYSYAESINYNTFQKYDSDGDGFLSKTELQKYFSDNGWSEKQANMCLTDLNDDGKLSYGELRAIENYGKDIAFEDYSAKYGEAEAKVFFKTYDTDGNGTVTAKEIEAVDNTKNQQLQNGNTDKSKGLSTGAIIGIIVGAVCVVGLIIGLIAYLSRDKKKKQEENAQKENTGNSFDKERKDISYNVSGNLHSINRSQGRQK